MGYLNEEKFFEAIGFVGRVILKWIFKKLKGGVNWIAVVLNRDCGRPLLTL
jgi:hypothetical protein